MNFFRRIFMAERLLGVAHGQSIVIAEQRAIIQAQYAEMEKVNLENARWGSQIIGRFLQVLEGEEDVEIVREVLMQALQDMREEVSRLEEHVL